MMFWSGDATDSMREGKEQRGGMGRSGLIRYSRPGGASRAMKGFDPGANKNVETHFYLVWILFKWF
jgi:hypothetical protein